MDIDYFRKAILVLRPQTQYIRYGNSIATEEEFNNIEWVIGNTEGDAPTAITQKECPHPEITWSTVQTEMDRLEAEYVSKEYARNRVTQYPRFDEFVEAYTEKEIGEDSTKWDAYVTKYNKARSDNPKP